MFFEKKLAARPGLAASPRVSHFTGPLSSRPGSPEKASIQALLQGKGVSNQSKVGGVHLEDKHKCRRYSNCTVGVNHRYAIANSSEAAGSPTTQAMVRRKHIFVQAR